MLTEWLYWSIDQNLEKIDPVTVQIYDVNQPAVVAKFLDMYLSNSSASTAISPQIRKYGIPFYGILC